MMYNLYIYNCWVNMQTLGTRLPNYLHYIFLQTPSLDGEAILFSSFKE